MILLGKQAAIFAYVIPFISSCSAGAVIGYFFINIPVIKKVLLENEIMMSKDEFNNTHKI